MKWQKLTVLGLIFAANFAYGVTTDYWSDASSKDFKAGETKNIVISNLDRITLGLASEDLMACQADVSLVFDTAVLADGSIVAATGSQGKLMIYRNSKWDVLYTADQPYLFTMTASKANTILLGCGGSEGKVVEISADGKTVKEVFSSAGVRYVWQIRELSDGRLIVATGPSGKAFLIDRTNGQVTEVFSCKQKNLQALAIGEDGSIYVGTDGDAIIYKINQDGDKFVSRAIYDAEEKEISVLEIGADGFLYAATASGIQGKDQANSYVTKPAGMPVAMGAKKTDDETKKKAKAKDKNNKAASPAGPDGPGMGPMMPPMGGMNPMGPRRSGGGSMGSGGNAIYRFDKMGFVTELFRDKVDINAMLIDDDGTIYLATGPDGYFFKVDPKTEEVALLAKSETKNLNSILRLADGGFIFGTASPAKVIKLGSELAKEGSFTSKVFDAEGIARWGMITVTAADSDSGEGKATIQTRSSEVKKTEDEGWSAWSTPVSIREASHINSPCARYLQYRINFEAKDKSAAVIDKIQIAYMQDNRRPEIESVVVDSGLKKDDANARPQGPANMPPGMTKPAKAKQVVVKWKASDPNRDSLKYSVYLKRDKSTYWLELVKNSSAMLFKWDPYSVADGKYKIKVIASDELANPVGMGLECGRVSDSFFIDNTPPKIKIATVQKLGDKIVVTATATDELTEIDSMWIKFNADKDWQYIAPADDIYDSKTERIEMLWPIPEKVTNVSIMIKAEDRHGNIGYGSAGMDWE